MQQRVVQPETVVHRGPRLTDCSRPWASVSAPLLQAERRKSSSRLVSFAGHEGRY